MIAIQISSYATTKWTKNVYALFKKGWKFDHFTPFSTAIWDQISSNKEDFAEGQRILQLCFSFNIRNITKYSLCINNA